MNTTSRALLQTLLTTDSTLTETEKLAMNRILAGEPESSAQAAETLAVTQKMAAKLLSVNRVTVWRMTKDELLHPVELLPGTWRYRYDELASLARRGWRDLERLA
jgi:hypothetical protein